MKKLTLLIASLFACAASSFAGSGPKDFPQTTTAPAYPSWTGFYVGVFGGYKRSVVDPELTLGGAFNQIPPVKSALESRGSEDLDNNGAELGGLLGYNYQVGHWVVGLEAAGGYLWARDSHDTGAFILAEGIPPADIRTSFKTHYLVTVGPRIGYALGPVLPYVTGGLAVGDLDWSQELHSLADPTARLGGSKTQTNAGWMVGGGLQYALTNHWSVRLQYQFIDLGNSSFDSHVIGFPEFHGHHEVSLTEHNASFAMIYEF